MQCKIVGKQPSLEGKLSYARLSVPNSGAMWVTHECQKRVRAAKKVGIKSYFKSCQVKFANEMSPLWQFKSLAHIKQQSKIICS